MQRIEIREKLRPYSRKEGTKCLVPCSDWIFEAFHDRIVISDGEVVPISLSGPVRNFLVQMDLERDCAWISGLTPNGVYELQLTAEDGQLFLTVRRIPKDGLKIGNNPVTLRQKILLASGGVTVERRLPERLSLGNWKAQDWDLVSQRKDPREFVPTLFLLGQKSVLSPRSGIFGLEETHTYAQIRNKLVREEKGALHILPGIAEYPVGRAHLQASFGPLQLEWSEGIVRKVCIEPNVHCSVSIIFPPNIGSYRFQGCRLESNSALLLEKGRPVWLDCFHES